LEESGNITYLGALLFVKTTARTALIICLFAAVMGIISELLLRQDSFQFPPNVSLQSILKVAAELVCLGDILDYLIYTFVFMYFQGYRLILPICQNRHPQKLYHEQGCQLLHLL
jgi:uncharacterized membrane protein YoaK (UPF0700 family)